jgi:hypothetical protein
MSEDIDIDDELLYKIKKFRTCLSNDNYNILIDIMTDNTYDNLTRDYLPYLYKELLKIIDKLSNIHQSLETNSRIDYERYDYVSMLVNMKLNTLYRIVKHEDVGIYLHRYVGMNYLLKKGYNPEHITDLTNIKEGRPDYLTSVDEQGHEVKILEDNRFCFTLSQIINFSENENIVIFERIRRETHNFYLELTYAGSIYRRTLKFKNILDNRCPYKFYVKDFDFDFTLRERNRILEDRRKQKTIDDAW